MADLHTCRRSRGIRLEGPKAKPPSSVSLRPPSYGPGDVTGIGARAQSNGEPSWVPENTLALWVLRGLRSRKQKEPHYKTPASPSAYITSLLCLYPNTDTRLTSTHTGLYFYTEPSLTSCLHQQPHLLPSSTALPPTTASPPFPPLRLTP
ncbi:unnamed protein product [Arctogadus glacialis]